MARMVIYSTSRRKLPWEASAPVCSRQHAYSCSLCPPWAMANVNGGFSRVDIADSHSDCDFVQYAYTVAFGRPILTTGSAYG